MSEVEATDEVVETPVVEPTPSPEPAVQQEASVTEASEAPAEVTAELYELPDGTKVDAETLTKEWRDNFMPEFTRRSQELASFKTSAQPTVEQKPAEAPWQDPDWVPENYQQLAQQIAIQSKAEIYQQILEEAGREEQEAKMRQEYMTREIEQLKQLDPKVNVNAVLSHASKYAFPSLIPAFQNMKAIEDAERRVEERVIKNMKLRAGEPVGTSAGAGGDEVAFPAHVRTGYEKAKYILNQQNK